MAAWQRTAAWVLLALAAGGALLPPLVLFLLRPKTVVHSTQHVVGQRPLDAFFLLDASSSVKKGDWALALDFAQDMASKLNASFPHFRAGLGQFSSHYKLEAKLSADLSHFDALPQDVHQLGGTTFVDKALCGSQEASRGDDCSGGALADLTAAPALAGKPGEAAGCGVQEAAEVIMLVTDGIPTDGYAALESAKHLKQRTNATLMGVLVGGEAAHAKTLYALTSCCAAGDMELRKGQPACRADPNWTCPHIVRSTSYTDLVQSSEWLAKALSSNMECDRVEERWNTHADLRSLWFLLLPMPMLVYLLWLRLLLCCPRADASIAVAMDGGGQEPIEVQELLEDPEAPVPVAEKPSEEPPVAGRPGTGLLTCMEGTLCGKAGQPLSARGGYKGKRWAPVRTAYIVNGQRMDVDYGRMAPPTAPNAARRGHEEESVRDTPEAYFADLDRKGDLPLLTLTLVDALADPTGGRAEQSRLLCRFGILLPLACTLALLPLVVLWSGVLGLLGEQGG